MTMLYAVCDGAAIVDLLTVILTRNALCAQSSVQVYGLIKNRHEVFRMLLCVLVAIYLLYVSW